MKYLVIMMSPLLFFSATAFGQEEPAANAPGETPVEAPAAEATAEAPTEDPKEEKRSPYYKKVQGWLWLEAFAGPSSYDPDQFGSLSLSTSVPNAPRLSGPEFGFAAGTAFGGPFFIGWFYRQANYDQYKLRKTGLDMQGNLRFIPYVHPIFRASIGYATMGDGNPYGLTNTASGGISLTGGVGIRIPIVRWISIATTFDWTFVAMSLRGDDPTSGQRFQSWITGQQFGATFALSFHFIGVRKN
jgi:hypothetical protein